MSSNAAKPSKKSKEDEDAAAATPQTPNRNASGPELATNRPFQSPPSTNSPNQTRQHSSLAIRTQPQPSSTTSPFPAQPAGGEKYEALDPLRFDKGKPFEQTDYSDNFQGKALVSNHFPITTGSHKALHTYDLAFLRMETEEDKVKRNKLKPPPTRFMIDGVTWLEADPARPKKRRIVWLLMEQFISAHRHTIFATDYFDQIITNTQLPVDPAKVIEVNELTGATEWAERVTYRDEYTTQAAANAEIFAIKIVGPEQLSLVHLSQYLSTQSPQINDTNFNKQPTIKALNTIISYRAFQQCFRLPNQPPTSASSGIATDPTLTTKTGNKFYGIASSRPKAETSTGQALSIPFSPGNATTPGFSRSVRANVSRHGLLSLNINTGTSIFYQHATTLLELINIWRGGSAPLARWQVESLRSFLKGINVRTGYPTNQPNQQALQYPPNFIGRVTGIMLRADNQLPQNLHNCRMISPGLTGNYTVANYFRAPPAAGDLVVFLGEGPRKITFPASLLMVIPGQMNKNTNEKPKAGIRSPIENRDLILQRGREIFLGGSDNEGGARQFDLNIGQELIRVPIETLDTPPIFYRRRGPGNSLMTAKTDSTLMRELTSGSWNLAKRSYIAPANQFRWSYVEIRLNKAPACDQNTIDEFKRSFPGVMIGLGMTPISVNLEAGHICTLPSDELPSYNNLNALEKQQDAIRYHLDKVKNKCRVDAVVIFLPTSDQELYGTVKRVGDQLVGISTICHVTGKGGDIQRSGFVKTSPDFMANLTMKLNLKVQRHTANHALERQKAGRILNECTMILGVDVTHPGGSAMKNSPSVAAVVGSVDKHYAQWPASLESQMPMLKPGHNPNQRKQAVEEVLELAKMVKERILVFHRRNSRIPKNIVIYRDGLSEDQFTMCQDREYDRIKKGIELAIAELQQAVKIKGSKEMLANLAVVPKILLICAVKRHNTRCYPEKSGEKDTQNLIGKTRNGFNANPKPGTIIKHRITYGHGRDFFLYSQNAIQGTARPTHYTVLVDEIGCSSDEVAQMTHNLSYIFGRATRSTGVCAPVYYADLAADRSRYYVRRVYVHYVPPDTQRPTFDMSTPFSLNIHPDLNEQMFYI